jgi:hypothetical protein
MARLSEHLCDRDTVSRLRLGWRSQHEH